MALLTLVYLPRESSFRVEELRWVGSGRSRVLDPAVGCVVDWQLLQSTSNRRTSPCVALVIKDANHERNHSQMRRVSISITGLLIFLGTSLEVDWLQREWCVHARMEYVKARDIMMMGLRGTVHIWRQYTWQNFTKIGQLVQKLWAKSFISDTWNMNRIPGPGTGQ